MARRMGKAADDQYMGGGTGNWKGAPKAPAKKTRGVATTEAVKKMKQKESSMAKPKAKPAKKAPIGMGAKPKPKPSMEKKQKPIRARLTDVSSPSRSATGKAKPSKPQSRSGEMVLGGGPNTGQSSKWNKMLERKRKS